MRSALLAMMFFSSALALNAQPNGLNEKHWSRENRLKESDFQMSSAGSSHNPCFAQFSMNYAINGFDFLTRNFNQKVENVIYRKASWLNDNASNKDRLLKFQQVLFDISEVYTRKFRKALLENRMAIIRGTGIAEVINQRITAEFTERRAAFEKETEGGQNLEMLDKWSVQIAEELAALHDFRYDNTEKIKLN